MHTTMPRAAASLWFRAWLPRHGFCRVAAQQVSTLIPDCILIRPPPHQKHGWLRVLSCEVISTGAEVALTWDDLRELERW